MSSQSQDNPNNSDHDRSPDRRLIRESLERAQKAMNRYDHVSRQQAAATQRVDSSAEMDARIKWHSAVIDAWSRLRPYVIDEFEDDWWEGADLGPLGDGLKQLRQYQNSTTSRTVVERKRHGGEETHTISEPNILPPAILRQAVHQLRHVAFELGVAMDVDTDIPHWGYYEVDEETGEIIDYVE